MAEDSRKPNDPESLKYEKPPQYYYVWQKTQNIPIHDTFYVESIADIETKPWDLYGGNGCFINLTDSYLVGCYVLEIPPGKSLNRIHHIFESTCYVISGRGQTHIEQQGYPSKTIDWQKRSLFAPPVNTHYRHENLDKNQPARLLVVVNAPLVMSLFHDERFVFGADFTFDKRYKGEKDYFERPAKYLGSRLSEVNFIRDVSNLELYNWDMRGKGARTTFLSLSDSTLAAHISSFEVGTYKKAHRHGAGAHVVMLDGEGYSLLWKEGDERQRVEWREGTMFAPPEWWWHQHFNTGSTPARYLAIRNNNPTHPLRVGLPELGSSVKQYGKSQIELEDEDPVIYADYAEALRKAGIAIRQERPAYSQS